MTCAGSCTRSAHALLLSAGIAFTDLPVSTGAHRQKGSPPACFREPPGPHLLPPPGDAGPPSCFLPLCFSTSALSPLQPNLYPTVGLQTPGEVVDANFGQHPFVFDIEDYMREWRTKIQAQIDHFPIGEREGEWQSMIQK